MDYKGNLWSAILALIIGTVMIFFSDIALHTVVTVVGVLFITIAVFNLAFELSRKRKTGSGTSVTAILASAGAGILGILMVFTPADMINLMIYLFAAAIILLGTSQIVNLAFAYKPITFPFWFYIFPALLVITGVVICLIGAQTVGKLMILITGISLVVYAIATFIGIAGLLSFRRKLANAQNAAPATEEEVPTAEIITDEPAKPFWPAE